MGISWWGRGCEDPTPVEPTAACEAFLDGRYLEMACGRGELPPAWVWLSALAHGAESTIASAAASPAAARPELEPWVRVQRLLARRVLEVSQLTAESLTTLQRTTLIPLELSLIGATTGPSTLLRVVSTALDQVVPRPVGPVRPDSPTGKSPQTGTPV